MQLFKKLLFLPPSLENLIPLGAFFHNSKTFFKAQWQRNPFVGMLDWTLNCHIIDFTHIPVYLCAYRYVAVPCILSSLLFPHLSLLSHFFSPTAPPFFFNSLCSVVELSLARIIFSNISVFFWRSSWQPGTTVCPFVQAWWLSQWSSRRTLISSCVARTPSRSPPLRTDLLTLSLVPSTLGKGWDPVGIDLTHSLLWGCGMASLAKCFWFAKRMPHHVCCNLRLCVHCYVEQSY